MMMLWSRHDQLGSKVFSNIYRIYHHVHFYVISVVTQLISRKQVPASLYPALLPWSGSRQPVRSSRVGVITTRHAEQRAVPARTGATAATPGQSALFWASLSNHVREFAPSPATRRPTSGARDAPGSLQGHVTASWSRKKENAGTPCGGSETKHTAAASHPCC